MRSFIMSSLLLLCAGVAAHAVSFKNTAGGVWSTGLNSAAVVLSGNTADSHYVLIQPEGCDTIPTPANCTGFGPNAITVVGPPGTIWSANDTNSAWVGPIGDQQNVQNNTIYNSASDYFVYRLLVNFATLGMFANTAQVDLRWLSDNNVNNVGNPSEQSHIRVCPVTSSTDPACAAANRVTGSNSGVENTNPFSSQAAVTIGPSYFTSNLMAIDFVVFNSPLPAGGANPTGLRVEILSATAETVPEPMTMSMIGLGLLGIGFFARRK